jgi:hypothetical protein
LLRGSLCFIGPGDGAGKSRGGSEKKKKKKGEDEGNKLDPSQSSEHEGASAERDEQVTRES